MVVVLTIDLPASNQTPQMRMTILKEATFGPMLVQCSHIENRARLLHQQHLQILPDSLPP